MQPFERVANGEPRSARAMRLPEPPILRQWVLRALKVSGVVGTCLTLINQGDLLFGSAPAPALWWKIPLTYCVPFCVSLYSAMATLPPTR